MDRALWGRGMGCCRLKEVVDGFEWRKEILDEVSLRLEQVVEGPGVEWCCEAWRYGQEEEGGQHGRLCVLPGTSTACMCYQGLAHTVLTLCSHCAVGCGRALSQSTIRGSPCITSYAVLVCAKFEVIWSALKF